jgi:hypothetical protein
MKAKREKEKWKTTPRRTLTIGEPVEEKRTDADSDEATQYD